MNVKLSLITLLTNDVPMLSRFYKEALGFETDNESENYVELFTNSSIRFAICNRSILADSTSNITYNEEKRGQSFELAFAVKSKEELEVFYHEILSKGAKPVKAPSQMPWGQTTAFFSDPDGNIHELFVD